jgi:hypothetical protein
MSISVDPEDRLITPIGDLSLARFESSIIACLASLAINAAFILAMISQNAIQDKMTASVETPIEVIVEAPSETAKPEVKRESVTAASLPKSADADQKLKGRAEMVEVADEKHEQKTGQKEAALSGVGNDETRNGAPQDPHDKGGNEDVDPDPDKEISRLVRPPQPTISLPRAWKIQGETLKEPGARKKPDEGATDDETTMKRKKVTCGANARITTVSVPSLIQARVLGFLTKDQAARVTSSTDANADFFTSPDYLNNIRIAVHVDGRPEGARKIVLLPPGLSVQIGDHIEYLLSHLDPSMPCHRIPNLVSRVL